MNQEYMIEFTWLDIIYHVFTDYHHVLQKGIDPLGDVRYHDVPSIKDSHIWLF